MFKQLKAAKALALVAVMGCGHLFAVTGPTTTGTTTTTSVVAGGAAKSGAFAPTNFATTSSATVTEASLMAVKVAKIMGLVGAVTAEAAESMGSGVGMAATGADAGTGLKVANSTGSNHRSSAWLRASMGAVDNAVKDQQWNGQSYLTMIGADYKFNNMFCAGLGLSYSHLNARTEFNKGTMKQDTLGVNPYLIIVPHKNFNFEFVGGWSTTNGKDTRHWQTTMPIGTTGNANLPAGYPQVDGAVVDGKYKSSPKSQAMFGGVFANFVNKMNKTSFSLQVGYLMMQSKMKKFSETSLSSDKIYTDNAAVQKANTYKAGTLTGKILVLYQMTPSVAPFLNVHGQHDVKENKGVSYEVGSKYKVNRSAFGGGGGFHVRNDDALSGSLQFDYTARGQLKTYVTGLRLHYGF